MLFWIFVIILAIGIAWCIFSDCNGFAWILCAIGVITVVISLLILMANHTGVDGYIAQMNERREMLVYQYENDLYDNDNDLGKRELMIDIQEWNEDLARLQENQDDFWIGIYQPNIYDQFEFIELEPTT